MAFKHTLSELKHRNRPEEDRQTGLASAAAASTQAHGVPSPQLQCLYDGGSEPIPQRFPFLMVLFW